MFENEAGNGNVSDGDRITALERRVKTIEMRLGVGPTGPVVPSPDSAAAMAAAPEPTIEPAPSVDTKIGKIVEAAREETERGRKARRQ